MPPSFLSFCHQTDLTNRFNNPIGFLLTLNWGRNDSHTSFQRPSLCRHCRILRPKISAFSPGRWGAIAHSKKYACCPWRSRCVAVRRVESRDAPIQILVLMVRPPTCSTQFVLVVTSTVCARLCVGCPKMLAGGYTPSSSLLRKSCGTENSIRQSIWLPSVTALGSERSACEFSAPGHWSSLPNFATEKTWISTGAVRRCHDT